MPTKAELAKFSAKAAESSSTVAAGTTAPSAKVEGEATAKGETGGKKTKQTDKAEAGGKKAKQDKGAKGDGGQFRKIWSVR